MDLLHVKNCNHKATIVSLQSIAAATAAAAAAAAAANHAAAATAGRRPPYALYQPPYALYLPLCLAPASRGIGRSSGRS